ncbi:hypothetical protein WJX74_007911 [Apatococcus lobatus]|uniref:Uncharacterized protein n=1 Tax=Apatococcus lobatus TaxID=904363 RepID=A0AAW1RVY3_9CHLO
MSQTSAASTPEQLVEAVRNAGPANLAPLQDARLFLYSGTVEPSDFVAMGGVKVLTRQPEFHGPVISEGILDDLIALLEAPPAHAPLDRRTIGVIIKSLAGCLKIAESNQVNPEADPASFWKPRTASSLVDLMLIEGGNWTLSKAASRAVRKICFSMSTTRSVTFDPRDLGTLVELVEQGKCPQEQQATIKAIARTAAMSPLNEAVLVDAGAIKVLVDMAGGNDGVDGKQHEPETLAMVAWALGFFAERFKNHGDSIIFLGGCKAIVNLLKHDSTAVQDAAVFATASLMKWNLGDVKRSFAHNEGISALLIGLRFQYIHNVLEPKTLRRAFGVLRRLLAPASDSDEAAPRAGEQFLLTTKMVMSDGIPLLLALARMESQEIAGLSVAMLQRILSYDTRYKRVVLSVTKDPELITLIEEGCPGPLPGPVTQTNNLLASMSSPAPQAVFEEAALLPHASTPPTFYSHPPLLHATMSSGTMSGSSGSNPNIIEPTLSDAEVSGHSTSHSLSDLEGNSGSPQSVLRDRYDPDAAVHSQPPAKISPKPAIVPLQQFQNAIAEHPEMGSPVHLIPMSFVQDHAEGQMLQPAAAHFIPMSSGQVSTEERMMAPATGLFHTTPTSRELLEGTSNNVGARYRLTRRPDEPTPIAATPEGHDLTGSNQASAQQSKDQLHRSASDERYRVVEQSSSRPGSGAQQQRKTNSKPHATTSFCFKHDVKIMPSKKAFLQCWGA